MLSLRLSLGSHRDGRIMTFSLFNSSLLEEAPTASQSGDRKALCVKVRRLCMHYELSYCYLAISRLRKEFAGAGGTAQSIKSLLSKNKEQNLIHTHHVVEKVGCGGRWL